MSCEFSIDVLWLENRDAVLFGEHFYRRRCDLLFAADWFIGLSDHKLNIEALIIDERRERWDGELRCAAEDHGKGLVHCSVVYTACPMSKRTNMVASAIRGLIAPILLHCPKECGIVTITDVEVSKDFMFATVSISALSAPEVAVAFLEKQRMQLQRRLSALNSKRIPQLRFRYDDRSERGAAIEKLLH